eukprot:Nk52_evm1s1541 gene=Nk52_evmTU1s1541
MLRAQLLHPAGEIGDLQGGGVGDRDPVDPRGAGVFGQPGALALGAGDEFDGPVDEGPHMRLHRLAVLVQHGLLDLGDQTLVGHVHPVDRDLGGLLIEEVVQLPLREGPDRLVGGVEAGGGEDLHVPAAGGVVGD